MQLCPATLILDSKLRPVPEQGYTCPHVIPHDSRVVQRGKTLGIPVIRRCSERKKNLGGGRGCGGTIRRAEWNRESNFGTSINNEVLQAGSEFLLKYHPSIRDSNVVVAYIDGLCIASYGCPMHGCEALLPSEVNMSSAWQQGHDALGVAVTSTGHTQGCVYWKRVGRLQYWYDTFCWFHVLKIIFVSVMPLKLWRY